VTDQFQHVMVRTSIIIGLGITHILVGIGSAIDRLSGHGHCLRLSWAHGAWLAALFVWMVLFWWWQFRLLGLLKAWTLGHYFFIIVYAVLLFLLAVIFGPKRLGGHRQSGRLLPLKTLVVLSRVPTGEHCRSRGFIPQGRMAVCIRDGCGASGLHSRVDPRLPRWSSIKKHPRSFLYGSRVLAVAGDCRL